jgi:DnaJ-class molecular chaperone
MFDLSQPNSEPGVCVKCKGTGVYGWGASINGKMQHSGTCFSCRGTGKQSRKQIKRNETYNRHKIAMIARL